MKKLTALLTAATLLASSSSVAMAADREARQPDVFVNSKIVEFADQNAYITDEGRTLVPARGVFEAMDCEVGWDADNYVVTVTNEAQKKEITLTIDDTEMKVVTDGKEEVKTLDVPAQLMNNRTMVPLRAISEALGCMVVWNDAEYSVNISVMKQITAEEFNNVLQNIFNGSAGDKEDKEEVSLPVENENLLEIKQSDCKIVINVPEGGVKAGKQVSVAVNVENNPGLAAILFKVEYDKNALALTNIIDGEVFGNGIHNVEKGILFWVSATDIIENGTIVTLEFAVNEDAIVGEYPITLRYDPHNDVINQQLESVEIEIVEAKIVIE